MRGKELNEFQLKSRSFAWRLRGIRVKELD